MAGGLSCRVFRRVRVTVLEVCAFGNDDVDLVGRPCCVRRTDLQGRVRENEGKQLAGKGEEG